MTAIVNRKFSHIRYIRDKIAMPIFMFSGSPRSTEAYPILTDQHRHRKHHGSRSKPEVHISLALVYIETKFQRLYLSFRGRRVDQVNINIPDVGRPTPIPETRDEIFRFITATMLFPVPV